MYDPAAKCGFCGRPARMHPQSDHVFTAANCSVSRLVRAIFGQSAEIEPEPICQWKKLSVSEVCNNEQMVGVYVEGLLYQVCGFHASKLYDKPVVV